MARSRVEPDVEDVALALERPCRRRPGRSARRGGTPRSAARTRRRRRRCRTPPPRARRAPASAALRRTRCSRPPGSARPTPAAARCTSRAGSRPCCRCDRGPTPASTSHPCRSCRWRRRAVLAARPAGPARDGAPVDGELLVHRDEPLRRGQEDHRVVAAPAVRIRVLERLAMPEAAALLERLLDVRVCIEHALTREQLDGVEKVAARADRRVDLQAVLARRSRSRRCRGLAPCARRPCPARG